MKEKKNGSLSTTLLKQENIHISINKVTYVGRIRNTDKVGMDEEVKKKITDTEEKHIIINESKPNGRIEI